MAAESSEAVGSWNKFAHTISPFASEVLLLLVGMIYYGNSFHVGKFERDALPMNKQLLLLKIERTYTFVT